MLVKEERTAASHAAATRPAHHCGEPAVVHWRVMLGQDHAGAALRYLKLAGHGAGCPAQAGRGDHVEHVEAGAAIWTPNGPRGRPRRPQPVSIVSLPLTTR